MTLRRRRRTAAAALALAAAVALAAPAHAAGRHAWTANPGWIEAAVQWIAGVWTGNTTERGLKVGSAPVSNPGSGPDGAAALPVDRGSGIDPDG